MVVSTPAAFCLQSRPSAVLRASSLSPVDCPPNFRLSAACSSAVPAPQSTSPVLQSCTGSSACMGIASASSGGPGNLSATVLSICAFVGRAVVFRPLSSASCFILARPIALDSFPSRTRCFSVSSLTVLRPPSGGAALGWARTKGRTK